MPSTPMLDHHGRKCGPRGRAGLETARSVATHHGFPHPAALAIAAILLGLPRPAFPQSEVASLRSNEEMQWGVRAFHTGAFNNAILSLERAVGLNPLNMLVYSDEIKCLIALISNSSDCQCQDRPCPVNYAYKSSLNDNISG